MDVSCATVTAPKGSVPSLASHFGNKRGFVAKEIDLQGRFHHPGHQGSLDRLLQLCDTIPMLRFPYHSVAQAPLRRNDSGELVQGIDDSIETPFLLHEVALRCILVEKADWYATMKKSSEAIAQGWSSEQQPKAILLGPVDCVPHSLPLHVSRPWLPRCRDPQLYTYPDHAVAIVGASGRFPGSETLEEFWDMIRTKKSRDGTIPEHRGYGKDDESQEYGFRGNYLAKEGSFDHAFFRKSPREAAYMDPQHRLALHLAYETLESSGYFSPSSSKTKAPEDVGCYIGVSSADYHDNVNVQPPTAFSFTGTARAFAPGRISHFFGWTGPSLAIDTACSSSMVAMHTAVRAIQSDECSMALAGGLNLITSPKSHHNLGGASFLSPSGQCRPFDEGADGYCRGEGAGFVLLKRLSAAVADNDHILGVIVGSATNNSKGNTSITVPSSQSQSSLYRRVLKMACMQPSQVSYVEAHGTGTQKGDPVEYQSIRNVFGGAGRTLRFGSVKGNIGHSESASGVASLIKSLLMLQHGQIPPQANLSVLNPALGSLEEANMEIPRQLQQWDEPFRAICVNNYGASGSNAVMIVCQPPPPRAADVRRLAATSPQYPFLIASHSDAALQRYCRGLLHVIQTYEQQQTSSDVGSDKAFLSRIAFNLAQKQNHPLQCRATFQAGSLSELKACLDIELKTPQTPQTPRKPLTSKPVVLVFAGQTGHRPRLSQEAYRLSVLLQRHLDRCDRVLQTLGLRSLFPHVFGEEPIEDLADLHCMQFSIQYAAASSWIDAGLPIKKVVGHSLGQLTALCVSGAISLRDGLKLVSGRAALIQTNWGPERGCMLSVDADIATVRSLLTTTTESADGRGGDDIGSDTRLEIACYNSASNHIVVGSEAAIARLEDSTRSSKIRSIRLPVSHGFHSHMVDSIMEDFSELVRGIKFSLPRIELEPCANMPVSWADLTPEVVAQQSREPVYFSDAVARVEAALGPSCIWLEAGSGPVGVTMVRRALESHGSISGHSFHSLRLHVPGAIDSLATTTRNLWKEGVRVQFWPFHAIQRADYGVLELPPYQFETSHHWISIKSPAAKDETHRQAAHHVEDHHKHLQPENPETSSTLVSFLGFERQIDKNTRGVTATFSINQHVDEYLALVQGRTVLGHTLAPSSVWLESAGRALRFLSPSPELSSGYLHVESVKLHGPFGLDPARVLRLTLRKQKLESTSWSFEVESRNKTGIDSMPKLQASGRIRLQIQHDHAEASQFGPHGRMLHRLIDHKQCLDIRQDPEASVIQGTFVRKLLSRVAVYNPESFGILSIAMRDIEAVARVNLPPATAFLSGNEKMDAMHPLVHDNFLLVAEMHASNLDACPADQVYICSSLDAVFPSSLSNGPWTVYSKLHHGVGTKISVISDIFVFNALTGTLELVILGATFCRIRISSLGQTLSEMQGGGRGSASSEEHDIPGKEKFPFKLKLDPCHPDDNSSDSDLDSGIGLTGASQLENKAQSFPWTSAASQADRQGTSTTCINVDTTNSSITNIRSTMLDLVSDITACVPGTCIDDTTCLSDLGVDSLSATELQARVKEVFLVDFPLRKRLESENLTLGRLCQEIWSNANGSRNTLASSTSSHNSGSNAVNSWTHPEAQASPIPISNKDSQRLDTERELISRLSKLVEDNLGFRAETPLHHRAPLGDMGLDSLVAIQLKSDIQDAFGKSVGSKLRLDPETTFEDLCNALLGHSSTGIPAGGIAEKSPTSRVDSANVSTYTTKAPQTTWKLSAMVREAPAELRRINESYGSLAQEIGWANFYASGAHQEQLSLVLAYITEAFTLLGCDLASLQAGDQLPTITYLPKYQKLVTRYHGILAEAGLIESSPDGLGARRTSKPLEAQQTQLARDLHSNILRALPAFSPEHQLLRITAPHLADCLMGKTDPLELVFSDKVARQLLTDVYVKSPLFASGNRVLGEFLRRILPHHQRSTSAAPLRILEIGGGTGGTTHLVLAQLLAACGADAGFDFEYTFTDISAGLIATTKRAFASRYGDHVASRMQWTVLNVEAPPPQDMRQRYDLVLSANCVHATQNLDTSCAHMRALLRPEGGMLCLVELTRPQAWLDCVFGLLDGWWRFEDGRTYALADERQWESILRKAGFFHVSWSGDASRESEQLRLITALSCG